MFVPDRPFQSSRMFVIKVEAYLSDLLLGRLQALLTDIRLPWNGLPVTSTLVYCEHS
jgi:hypothetical protein